MMDEKCMSGKKKYPVHQTSVEDAVKSAIKITSSVGNKRLIALCVHVLSLLLHQSINSLHSSKV
jgi:hypothetical protein